MADINVTILDTSINVTSPGTQGPAGSGLVWMGAYNALTAYNLKDVVSYLGSSYVCILAGTGNLPTNGTYWNIVAQSGYSGYSGFSGQSGASTSGYSGYSGTSGYSGYSGATGATGTSGFSGYSGISGYSGYSGFSGTNGASGISGYSGFSGISGYSGLDGVAQSGISGYSGFSGISGYSGYSGFSGISGYSGYSGISGYSGFSGISGYSGTNGASGISGYSGFSGISGYSGTNGIIGSDGASGFSGISGYSGFSGISGYSGIDGATGFSGFSGISGYSGYSGISGYSGYSGISGYSGSNGAFVWGASVSAGSGVGLTMTSADLGGGNAFLSIAHTASGALTSCTTTQNTYSTSRTATGGTASDNFIGTLFSRTNVTNGANLTSAGSVVKITGTDTQTANTLTPTYDLLALAPSLRSTGSSLSVTVANSVVTAPTNGHIYAVLGNTNTVAQTLMQLDGGTSGGQHVNLRVIRTGSGGVGGAGICLNQFSGATQATGSDHASFIYGSQFNTNSGVSTTGFYLTNQQNTGAGYNTAIAIYNYSTDFQTASNGSGLLLSQNGVGGNALQVYGANNVNSSTNGLVNYTLSNTQSGATVVQKIDTGTSAQGHTGLLIHAYNASLSSKAINILQSTTGTGTCISVTAAANSTGTFVAHNNGTIDSYIFRNYSSNTEGSQQAFSTDLILQNATFTSRTMDFFTVGFARNSEKTSGTIADNFNLGYLKRTNRTLGAGGTLTAAGSVLKLENVATQTAGTLIDSVACLSLVQDNDSTGGHILFNAYSGTPTTDGTMYFDGTNMKIRVGGATKTFTII